jgi:Ring finger domain
MPRLQSEVDIVSPATIPGIEDHSQSPRTSGPEIRHSQTRRTSSPDLRDIIGVYPDQDCYCVGSAVSKGRRCRRVTSHESQNKACALLAQGTRMMEAGQPIDGLLEEAARLVLCKANHEYQAPEVARKWRDAISSYTQHHTELAFLELGETIERLANRYHGRISHNQGNVPTTTVSAPDREQRGRPSRQPIEGECCICLDLLLDDESSENRIVWCAESCGNNFHRDCLNEWIHSGDSPRNSCPICRDTGNTWAD